MRKTTRANGGLSAGKGARLDRTDLRGLRTEFVKPFDLAIPEGGIVCVSGVSGSGKSLFLRAVADLDVNEGTVGLNGRVRSTMLAPAWRRLAPYVAAESGWWLDTVMEHFAPDHFGQAAAVAHRLGVGEPQLKGLVSHLSTGERQRIALVRALVLNSPVLLLDEPTASLDPVSVLKVEGLLRERADAGTIVLMVSHDPEQGRRLGAERREMMNRRLGPPL